MEKSEIRKLYKKKRELLSESEIESRSLQIANNCLRLPIWDKNYYHVFLPIKRNKEVNTEFLLHILQGKDKSVVLSRSNFRTCEMTHILLQENTVIRSNNYGIPEPVEGLEVSPRQLDIVFVPLLAFNEQGHRIGYGKGFYDRFLSECREDCTKIGLSFFETETLFIHENMDFPLDYCITPKKNYGFKNSKLYL
ncbi:5-formyltetrahydrofolate cyclo-ligase [Aureitalea sp. L0-47]|uniref:5-formyltetrahydrofolate cyclo-ligase n=1 Tax=Aureitalea sp. L0-47 TaxID=2816962 RepID=UPI0022381F1B|nr:5-formyltetrahydrofolate cyclo-ligase [Aureitalea sp. L0-47]MCW5518283.1 5-formyltetrahydrofolate cyclo-ligase [Aureitalea sp. L0-47]